MENLSASEIMNLMLKAEAMWTDSRMSQELKTNADAPVAVLKNQSARLEELTDKNKDRTVKVTWLDPCAVDAEDCENNCDLDEPQLSSSSQEYELGQCKKSGFSIDKETIRTNTYEYEEQFALGIGKAKKALDEYWAKYILTKLHSYAGVNVGGIYPYDPATNTTNIPADKYNLKLVTYLMKQMILNKMPSAYMIDNGGLWDVIQDALIDSGNGEGKGDANRANFLKNLITFDLFNFLKAGITEDTFVIGTGAVAFKTKSRNPTTPIKMDGKVGQTWWSVASDVLPGVSYDVYYEMKCADPLAGQTRGRIQDTFRLETIGDVFQNPKGCPVEVGGVEYTPTGVMSFTQVAPGV